MGTRWAARSGRRRRHCGLSPRLTTAEVTATEANPSTAARRPRGPVSDSRAAAPIHSFEWSAARESAAAYRSTVGVGVAETAAYTATSSPSTSRRTSAGRPCRVAASGTLASDDSGPGIGARSYSGRRRPSPGRSRHGGRGLRLRRGARKQSRHGQAEEAAADAREERRASARGIGGEQPEVAFHELQEEPDAEEDERGDLHREHDHKGEDPRARIE